MKKRDNISFAKLYNRRWIDIKNYSGLKEHKIKKYHRNGTLRRYLKNVPIVKQ